MEPQKTFNGLPGLWLEEQKEQGLVKNHCNFMLIAYRI